jgi:hypothetical protein
LWPEDNNDPFNENELQMTPSKEIDAPVSLPEEKEKKEIVIVPFKESINTPLEDEEKE